MRIAELAELAEMPEARVLRSASIAAETKISIPPPTAQHATPAPRLSSIEDFPTPGRNEFRARRGELAQEDHPEKRPLSLLQRLGRVG
jgi:cell division protein FtsZ